MKVTGGTPHTTTSTLGTDEEALSKLTKTENKEDTQAHTIASSDEVSAHQIQNNDHSVKLAQEKKSEMGFMEKIRAFELGSEDKFRLPLRAEEPMRKGIVPGSQEMQKVAPSIAPVIERENEKVKTADADDKLRKAGIPEEDRQQIKKSLELKTGDDLNRELNEIDKAVKSPHPRDAMKDVTMRARMDNFYERATAEYDVDGEKVLATPMFRHAKAGSPTAYISNLRKELAPVSKEMNNAIGACAYGRGTPEQVKMVTQELIRHGKLQQFVDAYPGLSKTDAIRKMQFHYGVGLDCAGYVQQAFLSAYGGSREKYGFKDIGNENLYNLDPSRFDKVQPKDVRPGDLIILKPPKWETSGHTTIVRDTKQLSKEERARYKNMDGFAHPDDPVIAVEVEASWGAGADGNTEEGGVRRKTWLYNPQTGQWADISSQGEVKPSNETGPYSHPMQGVYRPKH